MPTEREQDQSVRDIVAAVQNACSRQDAVGVMAHLAENVVYTLHIDELAAPFAGEANGEREVRAQLDMMYGSLDFLVYRQGPITVKDATARSSIEFYFRHRTSGEVLNGRMRCVWQLDNGRITSCQKYTDAPAVAAFLRLFDSAPPA